MAIYENRVCKLCGATFSGGPRAWYCKGCRKIREKERRKQYKNGTLRPIGSKSTCKICGKDFISANNSPCCSVECRRILKNHLYNKIYGKRYIYKLKKDLIC